MILRVILTCAFIWLEHVELLEHIRRDINNQLYIMIIVSRAAGDGYISWRAESLYDALILSAYALNLLRVESMSEDNV